MAPELRKLYQIRILRKILGRNSEWSYFCSSSKIEKSIFCHVTFLGGHVMVPELRKYQIRIPREISGWNSGLTFDLAQK